MNLPEENPAAAPVSVQPAAPIVQPTNVSGQPTKYLGGYGLLCWLAVPLTLIVVLSALSKSAGNLAGAVGLLAVLLIGAGIIVYWLNAWSIVEWIGSASMWVSRQ
jgi:hypothetical protein